MLLITTLAIVSLQNTRARSRDAKRIADVRQLQNAIELYHSDKNSYPSSLDNLVPNYMTMLPQAPSPADGDCTSENNQYVYSSDGGTYTISFCLGLALAGYNKGLNIAVPTGIGFPLPLPPSPIPLPPSPINPDQDYDVVHTLTFNEEDVGQTSPILLYRGSMYSGIIYYRPGTSGEWTSLNVSGSATTFPIASTTIQIAHNWNKSGNNYMTPSFKGGNKIKTIFITTKEVLSGSVGSNFMYSYADNCSSLESLSTSDLSNITSVGFGFMHYYAYNCSSLTSLDVPDTSNLTSVGNYFMYSYAYNCSSLTSLDVPDTSNLTSVGNYFMAYYAYNCSSLTYLILPKTGYLKNNNINLGVPSSRLNYLKGHVLNSADLTDWKDLVVSGKTLHSNYIRNAADVIMKP